MRWTKASEEFRLRSEVRHRNGIFTLGEKVSVVLATLATGVRKEVMGLGISGTQNTYNTLFLLYKFLYLKLFDSDPGDDGHGRGVMAAGAASRYLASSQGL